LAAEAFAFGISVPGLVEAVREVRDCSTLRVPTMTSDLVMAA
jgi:hypothetical protein